MLVEFLRYIPKLAAQVDVNGGRLNRPRADHRAFDQLVRVVFENLAVFKCASLAFVGVDRHVLDWLTLRDEAPFDARRKARAAAPAQVGGFHLLNHGFGIHRQSFFQPFVAAVLDINFVLVDVFNILLAVDNVRVRHQYSSFTASQNS